MSVTERVPDSTHHWSDSYSYVGVHEPAHIGLPRHHRQVSQQTHLGHRSRIRKKSPVMTHLLLASLHVFLSALACVLGASCIFLQRLRESDSWMVGAMGVSAGTLIYTSLVELVEEATDNLVDKGGWHGTVVWGMFAVGCAATMGINALLTYLNGSNDACGYHDHATATHCNTDSNEDSDADSPNHVTHPHPPTHEHSTKQKPDSPRPSEPHPHQPASSSASNTIHYSYLHEPAVDMGSDPNFIEEVDSHTISIPHSSMENYNGYGSPPSCSVHHSRPSCNRSESTPLLSSLHRHVRHRSYSFTRFSTTSRRYTPSPLSSSHTPSPLSSKETLDSRQDQHPENNEPQTDRQMYNLGLSTALSISLHKLPEGFILFTSSAFYDKSHTATLIFLALALHNCTEGLAIAVPLYMASRRKVWAWGWACVLGGVAQPIGAVLSWVILGRVFARRDSSSAGPCHEPSQSQVISQTEECDPDPLQGTETFFGLLFAFVAGMMLWVAVDGLLPAAWGIVGDDVGKRRVMSWSIVLGLLLMGVCSALTGE
ncbi:uncharacterized protein EV422DRAFT_331505 [Fimicolochytrium jonesii]|uniref:uncharacterized protein n=1 Tax=Fimicolochytrium jonesii TaxID=1396493 RepID=UPI0022FDD0BD|nr:uncharacterized protein EV422DRAFT_331505 [Fimicolochytrium jonesii]KAI8816055.1 hypothetical protein EV422DRAFT_331505 [Fimicolochytrium jonesii]